MKNNLDLKFSICMPVYNGEQIISLTLRSILTIFTPLFGPLFNLESKPFVNQYQSPLPQEQVAYN